MKALRGRAPWFWQQIKIHALQGGHLGLLKSCWPAEAFHPQDQFKSLELAF